MRRVTFLLILLCIAASAAGADDETALDAPITSVGLFKNGLVVVRRTTTVKASGRYRLLDVPQPVHGTFWVTSDATVETRVVQREVEGAGRGAVDFQQDLVGRTVTIHFKDGRIPPAVGTVVQVGAAKGEGAWDRGYDRGRYGWWQGGNAGRSAQAGRFLILSSTKGRTYVDASMIAYLQAAGAGGKVRRRRPVLLFDVTVKGEKAATLHVDYLAKGIAWAPSYRVDIGDPKTLTLVQKAVVKNELANLVDARVSLISGFPSVQFGHVASPLALRTGWASFFAQLNQAPARLASLASNMVTQQVRFNDRGRGRGGIDTSSVPTGEGVDLHYQDIGKKTLGEGESLALEVARGTAEYQRIVEWIVPDTRDAHGRRQRRADDQGTAWDALRFRNPLAFPMTTAPAMIVAGPRFNGQRLSSWVNAGEQTTLHVTKALSIRTQLTEVERPGSREYLYVGGNRYRQTSVDGRLTVANGRKEAITLVIRRQFSGELVKADGKPEHVLRREGAYSVNPRNELIWTLTLAPGARQELTLSYTLLVSH